MSTATIKLGSSKNLLISAFADDAAGELSLFQGRWWLQWTIFII